MRDDFSEQTKDTLAKRVGTHCSNPECCKLTSGPRTDPTKAVNIGVAAHITAAAIGGPRFDALLTIRQRSSISNAIWLCQNCAKLIDNDPARYTVELLCEWKTIAEERALTQVASTGGSDRQEMKRIRVILADDHGLLRQGVRVVLSESPEFEVVAEVSDGRQAIDLAKACAPDVVLMDLTMPSINGLEATRLLIKSDPNAKVLILSMHSDRETIRQARSAGAKGYLCKSSLNLELLAAVRAVARGESYFPPSLEIREAQPPSEVNLTNRQRQVLHLTAEGKTVNEIAKLLILSPRTVSALQAQLMRRLDIHNLAGLVRYALRSGIGADQDLS